MKYKWILFDLDGTLFDYDKAEYTALETAFHFFGYELDQNKLQVYRKVNKKVWDDFEAHKITAQRLRTKRFEMLAEELKMQADARTFSDIYLENLSQQNELLDGALDILNYLHKKVGLVLVTNGLKEVQRSRLSGSEITPYFDHIVISDEIGVAKPHAEYFDHVFSIINFPDKKDVLIIGDNLSSDIVGGINYKIDTCWFNYKKQQPDKEILPTYIIHNLDEIKLLIK